MTVAGTTSTGLSQALNASAISAADTTVEYFMRIPLDSLNKTAHFDLPAVAENHGTQIPGIRALVGSLEHIVPVIRGTGRDGWPEAADVFGGRARPEPRRLPRWARPGRQSP